MASRRGLRDLAALLALPAMWVDHDPPDIAAGLIGVLFSMLGLECAYARFDDPSGRPALEQWRPAGPCPPSEFASILTLAPAGERGVVTTSVATPSGDGVVRVTSMPLTLPGVVGFVLVGSPRADFPTEHELHLLRVAAGQAIISIHTARRLEGERAARFAAEAALHQRNAFLEKLAQDLEQSVSMLAAHAAEARQFATSTDIPPGSTTEPVAAPANTSAPLHAFPARLTRREAEVLGLLAQGMSNKEIAGVLWLSDRTVERHITSLYRKIGVERRSEATSFALRHGLVNSGKDEN
jgi:DNA-binding NarL/FixJ family response regulator